MYLPAHFAIPDAAALQQFVASQPFGLLCTTGNHQGLVQVPLASHLVWVQEIQDGWKLHTHLARSNSHSQSLETGQTALAVFQQGGEFVSGTLYDTPDAPTIDYTAVQLYGTLAVYYDRERLHQVIYKTLALYEPERLAWYETHVLDSDIGRGYLSHLVGIELTVTHAQGLRKASQNRNAAEQQRIANWKKQ